ncbi:MULTISPECIES: phage baseplate assembly protein [Klebsiella pneumoniae complex]|uniref:phage baseplate assembly protein n=1 Tax=Klebsiella pneumoniae complex TaxID=3390273 RepID=UPI0003421B05|nr:MULTISPECIES: phage late control protein D [Klebsiella]HAH3496083.1 phage tail protein [Escherichia coli]HBZ8008437.1 phage tail protein [Klebsiella variicola subsp. variicola]EIW8529332.1 phage tail protein [Klebsiella pneumoniae]EIX9287602.1 phage tail protein [Klebsiella pneumoniae]EIX9568010.1 phage tail protein [Klebsiella pneumoniae]
MATQNKQTAQDNDLDKVSVIVGGKVHSDWSGYGIDSDFLIPADAWSMRLGLPDGIFPEGVARGVPVQVRVGPDVVMSGRIDRVSRTVSRDQVSLSVTGRDGAAILVDCASPLLTSRQASLEEVIAQVVRPLGIKNIELHAESSIRNDKITTEPGERAWDILLRACAGRGLWPWFRPDGTLVIGGPDYTAAPVATLVMRRSGEGNNLLSLTDESSMERSFSRLTVLAQGHAHSTNNKKELGIIDVSSSDSLTVSGDTDTTETELDTGLPETGQHGLQFVVEDPTVTYYRPQVVVMHDADDLEQVRYRARKMMADARLEGYSLIARVQGHRTSDGVLWEPGQRIHVISEPHGIDAIYFLMGREFTGGRPGGAVTTLRLKEDGVWIPDAWSKKKKARKGRRKKKQELGIVDVEPG